MKKFLSVMLAAVMAVSVFAVSVIPAMAAPSPTATTATKKGPTTTVNGAINTIDVTYTPDKNDSNKITFEYTGEGTVVGWTNNLAKLGYVEGTDFTAVENPDGTYTITLMNADAIKDFDNGKVIVDVKVKFDTTTTSGPTKKNDSSKSPGTGIATTVIAGSIAVAGAGIAVLSATKKRDAE
ncbi:MAG: hypothetical protein HFJ97_09110 [Eubacterium sp.]|nr:hypothetical protein [Eubacterium sp.]